MTPEQEKAYIKNWVETGRMLEEIGWRELAAIDPEVALRASRDLLDIGRRAPIPPHRRSWSGLVDLQDLPHGRKRS